MTQIELAKNEELLSRILTLHDGDVNAAKNAFPDWWSVVGADVLLAKRRAPIPKHQTGDGSVTNASHVYDCKLANKLLPTGNLSKDQQKALDRFLTLVVNLPVKTRSGPGGNYGQHPDSDNVLDAEIMKAIETGQPLSDYAFARVCAKVALVKGKAKDCKLDDDNIKALINPLVGLWDGNGTTVDEKYFVVSENGKPVNIWKEDHASTATGLKDNGEPDEHTEGACGQRQDV